MTFDAASQTRGVGDVSLFKTAANSVVLIMTKDAIGSGSLISENTILTNFHVVGNEKVVTVVFKPTDANGKPKPNEIVKAQLVKSDAVADLALLRLQSPPPYPVRPLEFSSVPVPDVGVDVAAIGHPTGEFWTYTKGIVSQVRPNYEWDEGGGASPHRATVIQTQTPINPGNSGGPLLSLDGKLLGVNSFRTRGGEGLNFAVAAVDIIQFINRQQVARVAEKSNCTKPSTVFEGRNKANNAAVKIVSLKCDQYADVTYALPDVKSDPMIAIIDIHRRGKLEGIVYDPTRSGKWSGSIWDPNLDETFPFVGLHSDGKLMPAQYKKRCPESQSPLKNLKCG
jgi:hypothetical protein